MGTGASSGGCWTHDLFLARAGPQMNAWKPLHWALVVILVGCTPSGRDDTSAVGPDGKPLRAPDVRYEPTPRSVVPRILDLAAVRAGDVVYDLGSGDGRIRSEEHTSELQSLMRSSYAVFCLQQKKLVNRE